jgi:hypothetical protein
MITNTWRTTGGPASVVDVPPDAWATDDEDPDDVHATRPKRATTAGRSLDTARTALTDARH